MAYKFSVAKRQIFQSWFYLLAWALLPAAIVSLAFISGTTAAFALLLAPALVYVVWRWPKLGLVLIPLSFMFLEGLHVSVGLIPRQITWLPDVVIMIFLSSFFLQEKTNNERDSLIFILFCFFSVFLVSTLLNNRSDHLVSMVAFRNYFKYALLYFAITRMGFSSKDIKDVLGIFFLFVVLQTPLVFFEYLIGMDADSIAGGFGHGGSTFLVIVVGTATGYYSAKYMHEGKVRNIFALVLIFLMLGISEIKFGFFLLPFSVALAIAISIRKHMKRAALISSIGCVCLIGGITVYSSIYDISLQRFLDPSKIEQYTTEEEDRDVSSGRSVYLGRMARLQVAVSYVSQDLYTILFGVGPGQTMPSFFKDASGRYATTTLGGASESELPATLLELGFTGLFLSLAMMLYLAFTLLRLYLSFDGLRGFHCGLFVGNIVLMLSVFYSNVIFFNDSGGYLFWLSAAYCSLLSRERKVQSHIV